jgi:hypothetical protein
MRVIIGWCHRPVLVTQERTPMPQYRACMMDGDRNVGLAGAFRCEPD